MKVQWIGYLSIDNLKEFAQGKPRQWLFENQTSLRLCSRRLRNSAIKTWNSSCYLSNGSLEDKLQNDTIVDMVALL